MHAAEIFSLRRYNITIVQRLQLNIIFFHIWWKNSFNLFRTISVYFIFDISYCEQKCLISVMFFCCMSSSRSSDLDAWMSGCQSLAVSFVCILSSCQYWQLAVWLSRLWVHWSPGFSPTLSGYQDSKGAFQPKLQLQYMHFAHTLGVKFQHLLILRFQLLQVFTTVHFILMPLWSK